MIQDVFVKPSNDLYLLSFVKISAGGDLALSLWISTLYPSWGILATICLLILWFHRCISFLLFQMVKGISSFSSILSVRIQLIHSPQIRERDRCLKCRIFVEHSTLLYSLLYLVMFLCTCVFPLLPHIRFLRFAFMIECVGLNPCSIEKSFCNVDKYDFYHSH